jgi:hypothetical protein
MSEKHILQIADRWTGDIIAEFETEQWMTPHSIIFFATSRPEQTIQISRWVDADYVTLEPAPIMAHAAYDEWFLSTITSLPDLELEFSARFCIQDDGMIYETLGEWRASWSGDNPHEWEDLMVGDRVR